METKFDSFSNCPFPNCVELVLSDVQGSREDRVILVAELRLGSARVNLGAISATFNLTHGELHLSMANGAIARGSRIGDRIRLHSERDSVSEKRESLVAVDGKVGAGGDLLSGHATVTANGSARTSYKHATSQSKVHISENFRVKAKGGNTWEICTINQELHLDGLYLGDEDLCTIVFNGSPSVIIGTFSAQKRHIKVSDMTDNRNGKPIVLTKNKQKIASILATKSIAQSGDQLVLAEARLTPRQNDNAKIR